MKQKRVKENKTSHCVASLSPEYLAGPPGTQEGQEPGFGSCCKRQCLEVCRCGAMSFKGVWVKGVPR